MYRIIAGATGLIGRHLTRHWLKQNHNVLVVGRTLDHIKEVFGASVEAVTWNELSVDQLQKAEVVVNLSGAGIGDKRWSESRKSEILSSRVETTKKLAELLASMGHDAPPLFNASAIGIYGLQPHAPDQLPPAFDEDTIVDWQVAPDFLSLVGRQWEQAAQPAIEKGVRVVFLRFAVVLAKDGGALPQLMKSYKFYLGGWLGTGQQPFCWVALYDVIRAIDFLLNQKNISGPVNIVAPECVKQQQFAKTLGQLMDRPVWLKTPSFALKLLLGNEMATDLLLEGQHARPKRLLELGFHFQYPDLESALNRVL